MYQGVFTLAEYLADEGEALRKREQAPIKLALPGVLQEPRDLVQTSMSPGGFLDSCTIAIARFRR